MLARPRAASGGVLTRDLTQPTAAGGRITGRYTPVNVQAQVVD